MFPYICVCVCVSVYEIYMRGGCGIMVIGVGNEYNDPSSNPGQGCLHFA